MEINFNTKNLLILNYSPLSGGKFISLCLGISEKVLHQSKDLAIAKMTERWTQNKSYNVSRGVLEKKKKTNAHHELGCFQLSGFHGGYSLTEQQKQANDLWKELTNQSEYFFFMTDHFGGQWTHYPNARHILFKNPEKILKLRNQHIKNKNYELLSNDKNYIEFDQETIFDSIDFYKEIYKVCNFLNIDEIDSVFIEDMRNLFLNTISIGFN